MNGEVRCPCGARMIFGHDVDSGKNVPLDASAPVYVVVARKPQPMGPDLVEVRRAKSASWPKGDVEAFVSHFKTCPRAAEFSRGGPGRAATR